MTIYNRGVEERVKDGFKEENPLMRKVKKRKHIKDEIPRDSIKGFSDIKLNNHPTRFTFRKIHGMHDLMSSDKKIICVLAFLKGTLEG